MDKNVHIFKKFMREFDVTKAQIYAWEDNGPFSIMIYFNDGTMGRYDWNGDTPSGVFKYFSSKEQYESYFKNLSREDWCEEWSRILRLHMSEKHMSQTDLAKATGLSQATIHLWVSGKHTPNIYDIINVAKVLDIPKDQLSEFFCF